ncbi:MAG TPA: hypothetical protein VFM48_06765, partial [Aquabacterium sp.]|nr:hypothetical protein [Aquabacterium sp.]
HQVGWVSSSDGLLVWDKNGDGKINDGSELFGTATKLENGQRAGDGYTAMSALDSNHDGILSATDAHFKDLKVWVDTNHNGITDAGEMKSLHDLGIVSLDLHAQKGTAIDNGNLLGLVSSYTTTDGKQHAMADVWFSKDTSGAAAPTTTADHLLASTANADHATATAAAASAGGTTTGHDASTTTAHAATGADATTQVAGAATKVDIHDILAGPTGDILSGHTSTTSTSTTTTHDVLASMTHDPLLPTVIDRTKIIDDKSNDLLI